MEAPFLIEESIPPTGVVYTSPIVLTRARTVSLTCRVTYDPGATARVVVRVFFSPDGSNWDTEPLDYIDITLTAGATVQQTDLIAIPEHGWIKIGIFNLDTTVAATNVRLWYTIQSWKDKIEIARGAELEEKA